MVAEKNEGLKEQFQEYLGEARKTKNCTDRNKAMLLSEDDSTVSLKACVW